MRPSLVLSTLLLVPHVVGLAKLQYCGDAIWSSVGSFTFANATDDYWFNICANDLNVMSMGAAFKSYCTAAEKWPSWTYIADYCKEESNWTLPDWNALSANLTDDFIQSMQVVDFGDIDATVTWNNSILLSKDFYTIAYKTTDVWTYEYNIHHYYGWSVYAFWGLILLFGMARKLYETLFPQKFRDDAEGGCQPSKGSSKISSWIQRNLVIPATLGTRHQTPVWGCTIPTRTESIIVASFYILNFVLCCVSYEIFAPNLYYTKSFQAWRYIADRTGIICYANLPWLWMFSGRNNIFIWLTGWGFSTFNVYHRHIARVATIQAIVHSICYTVLDYDYLAEEWTEQFWYMGAIATIVMSFLLGLSTLWMRRRMYEVFLILHIVFATLVIVGLFHHTSIWDHEYDPYLWPLVTIWLFDRFARIARLIYCNVQITSNKSLHSAVEVTYDRDAHLLQLKITPSASLKPAAGQHYYIYQPAGWKMWENHPFTLASWTSLRLAASPSPLPSTTIEFSEKAIENITTIQAKEQEESSAASSPVHPKSQSLLSPTSDALIFYVRPFDSWTRRLQRSCEKDNLTIQTKMSIEGPYGERAPLHNFENVMFVMGGSGVTAALPYLQEFIVNQESSKHRTKELTFIWTTRQLAMVRSVIEDNVKPLLSLPSVQCFFHITADAPSQAPNDAASDFSDLQYNTGRPDIRTYISDAVGSVAEAGIVGSKVAVFVCGPAGMADEARAAVHSTVRTHRTVDVRYFEESFGF